MDNAPGVFVNVLNSGMVVNEKSPFGDFAFRIKNTETQGESSRLLCATSCGNIINSAFSPGSLRYGESYPRDAARSATSRPPMLAAKKAVRRAAALTRLAPAPKEVCILKTPPFARPAGPINVGLGTAAPVRLRRPYSAEFIPRAHQLFAVIKCRLVFCTTSTAKESAQNLRRQYCKNEDLQ